jgi:hypothetical protein
MKPSAIRLMLAGFTLHEDLEVSHVAVHSWPGYVPGEAIELLRGRTFARALH